MAERRMFAKSVVQQDLFLMHMVYLFLQAIFALIELLYLR